MPVRIVGIGRKMKVFRGSAVPAEDPQAHADLLVQLAETTAEAILRRAEDDAARIRGAADAAANGQSPDTRRETDDRTHQQRLADLARRLRDQAAASEQLTRDVLSAVEPAEEEPPASGDPSPAASERGAAPEHPAQPEQPAAEGVHPALRPRR